MDKALIFLLLLTAFPAHTQLPAISTSKPPASATFTLVQFKYNDSLAGGTGGSACTGTTCSVTVSAIGAGHSLIAFAMTGDSSTARTLSSVNGETWVACPVSCASGASTTETGGRYVISAVGGETSFTCTYSGTPNGYAGCGIVELSWSGASVSIDTSGAGADTSCTSCAGVALTLTGGKDAILQWGIPVDVFTAVSAPYSTNAHFYSGSGEAVSLNTASGAAPTWTQGSSQTAGVAAIALKGI